MKPAACNNLRGSGHGRRPAGMVLVELVVALAAVSLVCVLGMGAIHAGLESLVRQGAHDREAVLIGRLRGELFRAWDARAAHPLENGPWLVVEARAHPSGQALQRLWIKHTGEDGGFREWALEADGEGWLIRESFPGNAEAPDRIRRLAQTGGILLHPGAVSCAGGERPPVLRLSFPGAANPAFRNGFALVALW